MVGFWFLDCGENMLISHIIVLDAGLPVLDAGLPVLDAGLCILHFASVTCKVSMDIHTMYNQSLFSLIAGTFHYSLLICVNIYKFPWMSSAISVNNSWKHSTSKYISEQLMDVWDTSKKIELRAVTLP